MRGVDGEVDGEGVGGGDCYVLGFHGGRVGGVAGVQGVESV